ncbi:MAG TPA: hypothetical protein VG916_13430, partial [Gemmatimonadaceae bacterium]|nr:hypothetical protein [Gemmatimonadaceae bacterium]
MPSLHDTAGLIAGATSLRGAAHLAAALGFEPPLLLDRPARAALGLDDVATRAWVAAGAGAIRCCLVVPRAGQAARATAGRGAVRLAERAPQALWMVIVFGGADRLLAIAVPPAPGATRVVA